MIKNVPSINQTTHSASSDSKINKQIGGRLDKRDPKVLEAARMYEQAFLREMVGAMRQAIPKSDLVKESMAEKIYKDKIYDNYVEQWSNVGGVGLADLIYDQIIERFAPQQKQIKPVGPMPIDQGKTFEVENRSDKTTGQNGAMLLKFKPLKNLRQNFEPLQISSPWQGEIIGSNILESGERAVFINHSNNMKSTFIFKGNLNLTKNNLSPGENIGTVSSESNEFTWKLEKA